MLWPGSLLFVRQTKSPLPVCGVHDIWQEWIGVAILFILFTLFLLFLTCRRAMEQWGRLINYFSKSNERNNCKTLNRYQTLVTLRNAFYLPGHASFTGER